MIISTEKSFIKSKAIRLLSEEELPKIIGQVELKLLRNSVRRYVQKWYSTQAWYIHLVTDNIYNDEEGTDWVVTNIEVRDWDSNLLNEIILTPDQKIALLTDRYNKRKWRNNFSLEKYISLHSSKDSDAHLSWEDRYAFRKLNMYADFSNAEIVDFTMEYENIELYVLE